jgi:hypothetical protein
MSPRGTIVTCPLFGSDRWGAVRHFGICVRSAEYTKPRRTSRADGPLLVEVIRVSEAVEGYFPKRISVGRLTGTRSVFQTKVILVPLEENQVRVRYAQ